MAQLSQRDFRAISTYVQELYASPNLDAYADRIVHGLPAIIRSDICTFNEVNSERRRVQWVANAIHPIPDSHEIFARHMHEHPFCRHWNSAYRADKAVALSDFVSQRQWRDRAIYAEFYRPSNIEHMLGVALAAPSPRDLHVVAFRKARDFDQRDRLALDLLRPHFSAAYASAETLCDLAGELTALRQDLEAAGRALVVLGPGRRVRQIGERAQNWLTFYFSPRGSDRTTLPSLLDTWVRQQQRDAITADAATAPRRPLVVERDGHRLTVRIVPESDGLFLLLSERKLGVAPADLAALGLSPRETEVLAWLAGGKTNRAIADALGLSPLTIKHCLERVYGKLGVQTRAAATALAVAAATARH